MGFSSAYFIIIFFDIFDICAVACGSGNDTYQKKRKELLAGARSGQIPRVADCAVE